MSEIGSLAGWVVDSVVEHLSAGHPDSAVAAAVRDCLADSADGTRLFQRFLAAPGDGDVRTALLGRLTEALLADRRRADKLAAAAGHAAPPAPTVRAYVNEVGGNSAVVGFGDVDQSTKITRNRKIRIMFPIASLTALLLGGGGVAVYQAVTGGGTAGQYLFYQAPDARQEYVTVYSWTTDDNGDLRGTASEVDVRDSGSTVHMPPVVITGHQDSSGRISLILSGFLGISISGQGTLSGDTLTLHGDNPAVPNDTEVLRRTTQAQLAQIVSIYRHAGANGG